MKKIKIPYPHPQDDENFAFWLSKQDAIADAQIASSQYREMSEYLKKSFAYE